MVLKPRSKDRDSHTMNNIWDNTKKQWIFMLGAIIGDIVGSYYEFNSIASFPKIIKSI